MVDLDFRFGGEMRSHRLPITLTGAQRRPVGCHRRRFRLPRGCWVRLAHLMGMNTAEPGLEPLIGVEELAEYLGVPVRTVYDWRLSGRAPRGEDGPDRPRGARFGSGSPLSPRGGAEMTSGPKGGDCGLVQPARFAAARSCSTVAKASRTSLRMPIIAFRAASGSPWKMASATASCPANASGLGLSGIRPISVRP